MSLLFMYKDRDNEFVKVRIVNEMISSLKKSFGHRKIDLIKYVLTSCLINFCMYNTMYNLSMTDYK